MPENKEPEREYISTPEAAERANLTKNYIALLARKGIVEGFRVGQTRDWLVYVDSLEKYLSTSRKSGPKGPRNKTTTDIS